VLLNSLLGLEDEESVFLAEESWQDLIDLPVTEEILQEELEPDACIMVKDMGIGLHLSHPEPIWLFLTDRYSPRKILSANAGRWPNLPLREVEAEEEDLFSALTEYLSRSLAEELFCESCLLNHSPRHVEARIERLMPLLQQALAEAGIWGGAIAGQGRLEPDRTYQAVPKEPSCAAPAGHLLPQKPRLLEICCGSGMATQALIRLGYQPLAMDSDRCDLCQAVKAELLDPGRSFVLDARSLPRLFPARHFSAVLGFMVGLIEDFNWPLWKDILLQAAGLSDRIVLFTVYTQKEAELIAKAFESAGWHGRIIDNRDPTGIYDQWAYLGWRAG
jgi:hypothetical protein